KRTTAHSPENLRTMLNYGLAKYCNIHTNAFRSLAFEDSKDSDLIQLVDVLIGGIAFDRNKHAETPGTRPQKIELSRRILALKRDVSMKHQFDFWDFQFKERKS